MEIKLFSLCDSESASAQSGKKCICNCVRSLFPTCGEFDDFSSQKRMLVAVSQSLQAADVVIIAVQGNMYNTTKRMLLGALGTDMQTNERVVKALATRKMKESNFNANTTFPVSSELLPTSSYIHCGFAVASGGQRLIYLPVDAPKAHEVVYGSLFDYLAEFAEPERIKIAMDYRHKAILSRTIGKLVHDSTKVAFANTKSVEYILSNIKNKEKFDSCIVIDDATGIQVTDGSPDALARRAMEKNKTNLGIMISDIRTDDDNQRYIHIAFSNAAGTKLVKVFAEDGETDKEFTATCVDKLLLTLYNYDVNTGSEQAQLLNSPKTKAKQKKLALTVSIPVAVSALAAAIIALILK